MNFYQSLIKQIGVTDEITTCSCCGKENLKRTVIFEVDQESDTVFDDFVFLGSECARQAKAYKVAQNKGKVLSKEKIGLHQLGFEFTLKHPRIGNIEWKIDSCQSVSWKSPFSGQWVLSDRPVTQLLNLIREFPQPLPEKLVKWLAWTRWDEQLEF